MTTIECSMCYNSAILGTQKCVDLFVDRRQTTYDPLDPRCYNKNCVHCNNSTMDVEYTVLSILSYLRDHNGNEFYHVQWTGYEPTWEPAENLTNCPLKLKEFWERC